jgi:Carbohydrate binding domain
MADSAPRHLAEPSKRFGLSPLQQVFLVALVSLAAVTAVIALLTRDAGNGGRPPAAPAATRAQAATTATTAAAATTTAAPASTAAPATRPVRPTPGNLLADGDFERDLAGWAPLGGAEVERVEGGESGRWAAAVSPGGGSGAGRPGMVRRDAATTEAGTTYEAIFWVQAPEGGQVVLALRELAGGREVSADQAGYALPGGRWQQIAVEHQTAAPGSSLALEVLGYDLPGDGRLLVDGVDLQTE